MNRGPATHTKRGRPSRRRELALAGLTARQTECLALRYHDGLNHSGIARLLGLRRRVVTQHLQRGLERLARAGLTCRDVEVAPPRLICMDTETLDKLSAETVRALW